MAAEFNSTLKGLNLDVNELQTEGLLYSFALNATIENFSEPQPEPYRSNMASNVFCYSVPVNEKILGHLYISEFDKTLLFSWNSLTKESKITEVQVLTKDPYTTDQINCKGATNVSYILSNPQCSSNTVVKTNCFNWEESPRLLYKITDCTLNLYLVNGLDEDRILNFDFDEEKNITLNQEFKQSDNIDCDPTYINEVDCLKTKWNPIVAEPCIVAEEINGTKEKGVYQYMIAYSTYSGIPLTGFKSLTQPFHLTEKGGGIKLNLSNISNTSRYRFLTIIAVETIKGITTYHKKGVITVNQKLFIDTDNGGENISINNLLTQYPFYKSSNDFTESNNILFKAGVNEYEKFNLQPVINLVETEWVSIVAKEGDYKDPEFANKYKSVIRDEVYTYGIKIILDNSELGPVFPLIGRAVKPSDEVLVASNVYDCNNMATQRWEVENTAPLPYYTSPLSLPELSQNCECKQIYQSGEFAYWRSSETYPNNKEIWGDLCGQPIRHFKFPDIAISPHQSNNSSYDNGNYIFPMGFRIKSDMKLIFDEAVTKGLITQEQRNRIVGYKLVRGNRVGNEGVLAKGLLYDVWSYDRKEEKDPNFKSCDTTSTPIGSFFQVNSLADPNNTPGDAVTVNLLGAMTSSNSAVISASDVVVDLNPGVAGIQTSYLVPTEGNWVYNSLTGDLTFTPINNTVLIPTPINISVNELTTGLTDNATVTVSYLEEVIVPTNDVGIGVIRWDLWHNNDDYTNRSLGPNQYHNRVPFFGRETGVDSVNASGADQVVMDQEIAYAKEAGISFFAFYWYFKWPALTVTSNNNSFYAREFFKTSTSADKNTVKSAYILSNTLDPLQDSWASPNSPPLLQIGEDMNRADYHKVLVDGVLRPLVFYHAVGSSDDKMTSLKRQNLVSAYRVNNPTAPEPYIVNLVGTSGTDAFNSISSTKAQAVGTYGSTGNASTTHAYSDVAAEDVEIWNRYKNANAKLVPMVTVGYDRRPRILNRFNYENPNNNDWSETATNAELTAHLQDAINFVIANPTQCEIKTLLMYSWNEHDEGGAICPTIIPDGNYTPHTYAINRERLDVVKTFFG